MARTRACLQLAQVRPLVIAFLFFLSLLPKLRHFGVCFITLLILLSAFVSHVWVLFSLTSVGNIKREHQEARNEKPTPRTRFRENQETHPKIQRENINKPRCRRRLESSPPGFNRHRLLRCRRLLGLIFLSSWFGFCSLWVSVWDSRFLGSWFGFHSSYLGFKVSRHLGFILRGLGFVLCDFWVSR